MRIEPIRHLNPYAGNFAGAGPGYVQAPVAAAPPPAMVPGGYVYQPQAQAPAPQYQVPAPGQVYGYPQPQAQAPAPQYQVPALMGPNAGLAAQGVTPVYSQLPAGFTFQPTPEPQQSPPAGYPQPQAAAPQYGQPVPAGPGPFVYGQPQAPVQPAAQAPGVQPQGQPQTPVQGQQSPPAGYPQPQAPVQAQGQPQAPPAPEPPAPRFTPGMSLEAQIATAREILADAENKRLMAQAAKDPVGAVAAVKSQYEQEVTFLRGELLTEKADNAVNVTLYGTRFVSEPAARQTFDSIRAQCTPQLQPDGKIVVVHKATGQPITRELVGQILTRDYPHMLAANTPGGGPPAGQAQYGNPTPAAGGQRTEAEEAWANWYNAAREQAARGNAPAGFRNIIQSGAFSGSIPGLN